MRRAFTMIELLVAIAVLVALILVTAQVFQNASALTRAGQAAGDVVQEAVAIERQVRDDLARLSPDGVLGIHSVEVPNNYNRERWDGTGVRPGLINPALAPEAPVRCDQLVFFVEGFERSLGFGSNLGYSALPGMAPKTIGQAGMIRYGHALQFPELGRYEARPGMVAQGQPTLTAQDVDLNALRDGEGLLRTLMPFHQPNVDSPYGGVLPTAWTTYTLGNTGGAANLYNQTSAPSISGGQPEARRWLFTRTAVALGDDDTGAPNAASKRVYQNETLSQETLLPFDPREASGSQAGFSPKAPVIDYGRADVSAMSLADLRGAMLMSRNAGGGVARRPWIAGVDDPDGTHYVYDDGVPGDGDQRALLKTLFAHARAEREPPGNARFDQMLTNPVLGSAVSNFIVEWTWDEEVGGASGVRWPRLVDADVRWHGHRLDATQVPQALDGLIDPPAGVADSPSDGIEPSLDALWFGLPSRTDGNGTAEQWDRRVVTFGQFGVSAPGLAVGEPIYEGDEYELTAPATAAASLIWVDPNDEDPTDIDNLNAIDEIDTEGAFGSVPRVREYWALFGPNAASPLLNIDIDNNGVLDRDPSFTPWPTALRFTMTVHDPATTLEGGRVVQFVVPLPRRMGD
ncbi:MAG: type II secretion system GspH family protein [Phycisphaerales bacterium]|nr:type II secretion system GspH family protein [Phycisphaerales bacterium]